jgi:hypothetical protein
VRSSRPYRRVKPGVDTIPSTEAPRRVVTGAYFGRERVGLGLVGGGDSLLCLSTGRAHDLPAACRLEMLTECLQSSRFLLALFVFTLGLIL